jgi:predicted nuclease of restriction endonuclease-like (RecB) superfamily
MKDNLLKVNELFSRVAELIELARKKVVATVNLTMVHTYFEIGKMIVEEQQHGKERAQYGQHILKDLSQKLTEKFGKGFSEVNLRQMRMFYEVYGIQQTASAELQSHNFQLSWSHYLVLMRINNVDERSFYEKETAANQWSLKELQRQCNSALYERLALSRDKELVKQLSQKGLLIEQSKDVIKDPYILEFLGLDEHKSYSELQLESKIIDHLQYFLLELGKGFAFIGRQVRFTFDEKHFKVDLVFYNRLLRSFVVIDLKLGEMTHQDLGQMQMYVNYYDRHVKLPEESPTIGILLCQKESDAIVELTLPKDANIYASLYSLYLPDKQLLQRKLAEWIAEFDHEQDNPIL